MDDFIPPKPPEGLGENSKNVVEDVSSEKEVSNKGTGLFGRLFKSKKKDEVKEVQEVPKEEVDTVEGDDLFSSKSDELEIESGDDDLKVSSGDDMTDTRTAVDSDLDADLFSEPADSGSDVSSSKKSPKKSKKSSAKSKKSKKSVDGKSSGDDVFANDVNDDDLNNIKAALGIYEKADRSIRDEFETDPESFSKKDKKSSDEWVESSGSDDLNMVDAPEFAKAPEESLSKKSSKKDSKKLAKSFNDEFSDLIDEDVSLKNQEVDLEMTKKNENNKKSSVKTSVKKTNVDAPKAPKAPVVKANKTTPKKTTAKKSSVKKSVKKKSAGAPKAPKASVKKSSMKKPAKKVSTKSAKKSGAKKEIVAPTKAGNKKAKKVSAPKKPSGASKEDLPSFGDVASKKKAPSQFVKKVESGVNAQSRISEKKIEKLIFESASKKKNSMLDKTREKVLLTSFERQIKKIIASNIKALEKEEKKVVDMIAKKSDVIDKRLDSLDKKKEVIAKREDAAQLKLDKLNQECAELDADIKTKNTNLEKLGLDVSKQQDALIKLDDQKKKLKEQIANLKESLKTAKENHKNTLSDLEKESAANKKALDLEEKKLKKQVDDLNKQLTTSRKELDDNKAKVKDDLAKLSAKERTVDKKSKDLNKLIDEEKKILELLRTSGSGPSVSAPSNFKEEAVDSANLDFEFFSDKIDECENSVNLGSVEDAKVLYNELRDNFLSADLSSSEKTKIKSKLKGLFDLIASA